MDEAHADALLDSPLGRQVLTGWLGFGFGQDLREQLRLGPAPGTATLTAQFTADGAMPPGWPGRRPASQPPVTPPARQWQDVPADEVSAAVRARVARGDWRGLLDLDETGLLGTLATDMYGFGDETVAELTRLARHELRPVADALVSAPAARRWWEPVTRADQRFLEWDDGPRPAGPDVEQVVRDGMRAERAENAEGLQRPRPPEEPGTRIGAYWWSAPGFAQLTWTTGAFGAVPSIALGHFIDTFTPFEPTGATVWSGQITPEARVLEIVGPADWQALVGRFPRDVTGTHDGEWRYWGGVPGPWRLPDWEQVMNHYDGVHVTIGGYLASCGLARPVSTGPLSTGPVSTGPVSDGFTMLAGWIPDATLWLRDVSAGARRLGRWQGDPQAIGWDEIQDGWAPARGARDQQPAEAAPASGIHLTPT